MARFAFLFRCFPVHCIHMLAKKKRLTTEEFNRFFASGSRAHSAHLQLIHAPSPEFHGAIVVGKKVFKTAVKRNRLRRQLYAALYRLHMAGVGTGIYIVITKPTAKEVGAPVLIEELRALVGRTADVA